MDYSGYEEFPFPNDLTDESAQVKSFFMALSDEEQLSLLNGSKSYDEFYSRVVKRMTVKENACL